MIISKKELLTLYGVCYDEQIKATEINKAVNVELNDFAERQELSAPAVKSGYAAYKRYMKGNLTPGDEDYSTILAIVEDSFESGV